MKEQLLPLVASSSNEEPANFSKWIQSLNNRYANNPGTKVLLGLIVTLIIITLVCVTVAAVLMGGIGALVGLAVAAAICFGLGGVITRSPAIWNRIEMLIAPALTEKESTQPGSPLASCPSYGAVTTIKNNGRGSTSRFEFTMSDGTKLGLLPSYDTDSGDEVGEDDHDDSTSCSYGSDDDVTEKLGGAGWSSSQPIDTPTRGARVDNNTAFSYQEGSGAAYFQKLIEKKASSSVLPGTRPPGTKVGSNGDI